MPSSQRSTLAGALEFLAAGGVGDVSEFFTDDVRGWSPTITVSSAAELELELEDRDEALSDVTVVVDAIDVIGDKAIAEWRLSATHSGPLLVADDILVEPSGTRVFLAGATFAHFRDGRIHSFRSYYDDAALLEQLLLSA
jgi:ketosteroid isomerase-like protein